MLYKKILIMLVTIFWCQAHDISQLRSIKSIVPILIIGSGPAGLMAGVYGARAKVPTVIIAGEEPGGQLMGAGQVDNMPGIITSSGTQIIDALKIQVTNYGAQIVDDQVISANFDTWPFQIETSHNGIIHALTVIIATGAAPRKLGIPGEIDYWAAGVSACSICDCFLFKDKEVAIVGGGDAAVEHALNLIPYAKKITIFVRNNRMRAAQSRQELILDHEKVTITYNKEILEIMGNGTVVTGLTIRDIITSEQELFPVDGLFLAVGHNPNTYLFKDKVDLSRDGYIQLPTRSQQTTIKGIFAAGDVADYRFRQAGLAAGMGIQAALEAIDFLRDQGVDDRELKKLTLFSSNS